jgi:hypothetical protein
MEIVMKPFFAVPFIAVFFYVSPSFAQETMIERMTAVLELCNSTDRCDGIIKSEAEDESQTRFSMDSAFCSAGGKGRTLQFCESGTPSLACIADPRYCSSTAAVDLDSSCYIKPDLTGWCCFEAPTGTTVCGAWQ